MFSYNSKDKKYIISIGNIERCLTQAINVKKLCEYVQDDRLFIERVLTDVVTEDLIKNILKPNPNGNHSTVYYRVVSFGNRNSKDPTKYANPSLGSEIETLAKTERLLNYLKSSVRKNVVTPIEDMMKEEDGMDNDLLDFYEKAVMLLKRMMSEENTFYSEVNNRLHEIISVVENTNNESEKRNSFAELISWLVAISLLQDRVNQLLPKETVKPFITETVPDTSYIKVTEIIEKPLALKSTPYESSIKLIGRDEEMDEVHDLLTNERVVFISAVGGCGKTQLVHRYISEKRSDYNTIVMAKFETSLSDLLNSDVYFKIEGFCRKAEESDMEYAERKLDKIAEITDENDLVVIDNFDTLADDLLEKVLRLPCRILFTTRSKFDFIRYPQIELGNLKHEEQIVLFEQNYRRKIKSSDYEILDKILEYISGHTLTIVLFARLMDKQRISFSEMLDELQTEGINPSMSGDIPVGVGDRNSAYNHIKTLMRIDRLSDEEKAIMQRLSLLPLSGVPFDDFMDWCGIKDVRIINELIDRNWIINYKEEDYLLLHPIISDIVRNEMTDPFKQCEDMLSALSIKFARNWDEMIAVERMEYVEYAKSLYNKLPHDLKGNFLLFRHIGIIFKNCSCFDICKRLLNEFEQVLGSGDSIELAWIYFEQSDILNNIYDLDKSREYLLKAVDMMRRVNPDSYDLAFLEKSVTWHMHETYRRTKDPQFLELAKQYLIESDTSLEKSLSSEDTRFGSYIISARYDHKTTNQAQKACHLCNWAENAYYRGEYDKTIELAEESYKIFNEIFGENEPDTHSTMRVLAKGYSKKGDFKRASDLFEMVIVSREKVWGRDSKHYWRYIEHYADICYENHELEKTLELLYRIRSLMKGMEEAHQNYADIIVVKINSVLKEMNEGKS